MDTVIRFVTIIAWLGAVGFGLRLVFTSTIAAVYYLTENKARLRDEARGVERNFRFLRDLLVALTCAAWLAASGAY